MKQQLGLEYSSQNPESYIISQRLVQLQHHYGGIELASSIVRSKRKSKKCVKQIDRHVINLCETYSYNAVDNIYELIFGLGKARAS